MIVAQEEELRMVQTGEASVTLLRQPVQEINDPEQALRTISIEPDPEDPTTAYAEGFLDGALAGKRLCREVMTSEDLRDREAAYGTRLRPLPLAAALSARLSTAELRTVGWLAGWRAETDGAEEARECASCARRLFEDMDEVHHCMRDLEFLCSGPMGCFYDACSGPEHKACYADDEFRDES